MRKYFNRKFRNCKCTGSECQKNNVKYFDVISLFGPKGIVITYSNFFTHNRRQTKLFSLSLYIYIYLPEEKSLNLYFLS